MFSVLGTAAFVIAFPVTLKATSGAILNSIKKDQDRNEKLCRMARTNCENPRHDTCPVYKH